MLITTVCASGAVMLLTASSRKPQPPLRFLELQEPAVEILVEPDALVDRVLCRIERVDLDRVREHERVARRRFGVRASAQGGRGRDARDDEGCDAERHCSLGETSYG
jgi:hypothetical protein